MQSYMQQPIPFGLRTPSRALSFRELPDTEHPQHRLLHRGADALSDAEVLALILGEPTFALAHEVLKSVGGWARLDRSSPAELLRIQGMTGEKVARLKAALEISRRRLLHQPDERRQITDPADAAELFIATLGHLDHEELWVLSLDTKNRILDFSCVSVGCVSSAAVRTGEVFKRALQLNATSIIIGHNHPSFDESPSADDVIVVRSLVQAGRLLEVELLDSLVVAGARYVSMKERRLGW